MLVLALFTFLSAVALPSINSTPSLLLRTTSLSFLAALALATNAGSWQGVSSGVSLFCGTLEITYASYLAHISLFILGAFALISWAPWKNLGSTLTSIPRIGSYSLFAITSIIGGSLLVIAGDMITLYLSLELQSFAVYVIAAIYRTEKSATHSGLLYFMLGGLSSSLLLLGIALIYNQTGVLSFNELYMLLNSDSVQTPWAVLLGGIAIATGILFKVTAAPFHHWGPDVYDGVPTIITTWIAVVPKVSLLVLFLNITHFVMDVIKVTENGEVYSVWSLLLVVSSLLSLIIGTVVGLAQVRVKRLLAYSTVSHMGFLLLALSIGSQDSCAAYIFYVIQYTLTSLLGFMIVLGLGYHMNSMLKTNVNSYDLGYIQQLQGVSSQAPALAACFAIVLFSMAGVPPLVGFFAKQAVLTSAVKAGYIFVSIVGVVTSIISASYYLYLVRVSHFDKSETNVITHYSGESLNQSEESITSMHSYVVSVLTLALMGFIAQPDLLLDTSRLMALTLYSS